MYKFPYGPRLATLNAENFFDIIDLPPFSVHDFPVADRPRAVRDYCSYVLSTFSHHGIKARGLLLRLTTEDVYYPTVELLTPDNKQGVIPNTLGLGYVVTMTDTLDTTVTSMMTANDIASIYHFPEDVIAQLYVVTDGKFSKRSGTVTLRHGSTAAASYPVDLSAIIHETKQDAHYAVKMVTSLYGARTRPVDAGQITAHADGTFELVPSKSFIRNLMVMGVVDEATESTFSIGLNAMIVSGNNDKDRITDIFNGQINGLIVPPYERKLPEGVEFTQEEVERAMEQHSEWTAREAAYNTPELVPVVHPARVNKFVDPIVFAPWAVKTPTGEYTTNFLKLGSGNLFDIFQFWGEGEHYAIDADAAVGDLLLSITHRVEVGEPIVEYHRVTLPNMRFYLEEDATRASYRKLENQSQGMIGCRDYYGNPSSLISDIGLAVRVTLTGSLNLESGGWSLNGSNVFAIARDDSPARDYIFKVLGWIPRVRLIRKDKPVVMTSSDEAEALIPAHLLDIAYGAYLAGLLDGQEAMPRATFASQPTKPLHDIASALNFARGLSAKHAHKCQALRDKQEEGFGELRPLAEALNAMDGISASGGHITLTGDPVTITGTLQLKADEVALATKDEMLPPADTSVASPAALRKSLGDDEASEQ